MNQLQQGKSSSAGKHRHIVIIGAGLTILILIVLMGRSMQIEKKHRKEIAAAEERHDSALIARYPFLHRDSLHLWRTRAADSAANPHNRLASFIEEQRGYHRAYVEDSIASERKWRADSIMAARTHRADSIAQAREERRAAREEERRLSQMQSEGGEGTYNGHTIYRGPRGGRYYINSSGNKTYIK